LDREEVETFFDDLTKSSKDKLEKEADKLAAETLIPDKDWKSARLTKRSSPENVLTFAEKLRISPAIAAGRIRYESNDYTVLKQLISAGKLRGMFGVQAE
jgi:HTH-type transcriptional regulator/antitoxin HigA